MTLSMLPQTLQQADVQELQRLVSLTDNQVVKGFLNNAIADAQSQMVPAQPTPEPKVNSVPEIKHIYFKTISSYGWDETSKAVNIYISLDGVGESSKEPELECTDSSFEFRVEGLNNSNYKLKVSNLSGEIDPQKCTIKKRKDRVTLVLAKKGGSTSNWGSLQKKPERKMPKFDKDEDPSAGIMNMMKQMYDEGDDEMKKTIRKSWYETQQGKNKMPGLDM